jgi:hypothetical protein
MDTWRDGKLESLEARIARLERYRENYEINKIRFVGALLVAAVFANGYFFN